jgi:hypothetical protein
MSNLYNINIKDVVKAVRAYGIENYEQDGWDVIIECYSDLELAYIIGNGLAHVVDFDEISTTDMAIKTVLCHITPYANHRDEIQSTAF